jgi:oligosaccharide repeat unit polymerase
LTRRLSPNRKFAYWLLIGAVLLIVTPSLTPRTLGPKWGLVVASCSTLVALAIIRFGSVRFDWLNALGFFVAHFFLLFVAAQVIILIGVSYIIRSMYGGAPEKVYDLMNRATLYASAFFLSLCAGFLFSRRTKTQANPSTDSRWQVNCMLRLRLAAWLALGCSYAGCAAMALMFGGVGNLIGDPSGVIESRGTFWPIVMIWASLWSFAIFYASYLIERKRSHLMALALTLPTMLFEFLTGSTKMALILPVFCFLVLRHYLVKKLDWKFIPKLAVFTLLLFVVGYSYRGGGAGEFKEGLTEYAQNQPFIFQTFFGRFYGTDAFMVVLEGVDKGYPLQWGRTMADLLYFYVPRAIWPNKPDAYTIAFGTEFMGASFKAGHVFFTPTTPAELYLNFGRAGLVGGGFLMGLLLWHFYYYLAVRPSRRLEHLIIYAVLVAFTPLFLSGPISTIVEYIVLRSVCFAVLYSFAGRVIKTAIRDQFSEANLAPST